MTKGIAKIAAQVFQIVQRSPLYSHSNQVHPRHIEQIAKAGYRTILALRPDGEGPNQPTANELAIEARKHGIAFHYVPVPSNDPDAPDPLPDFKIALAKSQAPILAYCRSGNRAATLWHQSFPWNGGVEPATVVGKLIKEYQTPHDHWY